MWRFAQRLERRGKLWAAPPSSWIQDQEAMDYACAPPGKKTRLKMTISNTLTVHSARLLTTLTIRWTRLYMSAHSYAVTFHCILINTWLNQARTILLITQDKKNTTHAAICWMSGGAALVWIWNNLKWQHSMSSILGFAAQLSPSSSTNVSKPRSFYLTEGPVTATAITDLIHLVWSQLQWYRHSIINISPLVLWSCHIKTN